MTNIHPMPSLPIVSSFDDAGNGRFAHIYDAGNGTHRLRWGVGNNAGVMFKDLKEIVAQELFAMWMAGASIEDMHIEAHHMGVRG